MAKLSILRVGPTLQLLNSSGNIEWSLFKNTPPSLVSSSGHNHDLVYYPSTTVDALFKTQEDRVDILIARIEDKKIKHDVIMAGGGTVANATIHNYNLSTEVFSLLTAVAPFTTLNTPGISSAYQGYFTNASQQVSVFDYFTRTLAVIPNCPILIKGTMIDYAIQTKGFVSNGATGWQKLDINLNTWEARDYSICETDGRPLLSSQVKGYSKKQGAGLAYEYAYLSSTSRSLSAFTTIGITSGLSISSFHGYWLSAVGGNYKHTYATDAFTVFTGLSDNVNNANVSTGDAYGLIVSGSNTTNVRKLNWITEAITIAVSTTVDKTGASALEQ